MLTEKKANGGDSILQHQFGAHLIPKLSKEHLLLFNFAQKYENCPYLWNVKTYCKPLISVQIRIDYLKSDPSISGDICFTFFPCAQLPHIVEIG